MKVGTDGVLLGAWTDLSFNPFSALDIGAGTGLLSLMLAQRSNIEVLDEIEIDELAHEQCVQNFEDSLWNDRLFCYHAGLDEFVEEIEDSYDLIISNPPFYNEQMSSGDIARDRARQNSALPFDELIESVSKLLSPSGSFSVVIPYKEELHFKQLAKEHNLFPKRITRIKGTPSSDVKRSLIEFTFNQFIYPTQELTIEKSRHQYTSDYIKLTKDFYLKM